MLGVYVLIWGIAYQQVENLTIEPRISARAVDLHPAVSFGSALLGAQLFGLSGALLGVPVAATVMAMLEIYKRRYELSAATEERVAVLVAPRSERGEGRDTAEPVTVAAREALDAARPRRPGRGPHRGRSRRADAGAGAPAGGQVSAGGLTGAGEEVGAGETTGSVSHPAARAIWAPTMPTPTVMPPRTSNHVTMPRETPMTP